MSEHSYAFGDTNIAGTRLRLAAEVFQPEMESFLAQAQASPGLAYDLGCGPGFTTRIVAGAVGPTRTVGLDTSRRFIEMARAEPTAGVEYVEHDVTRATFPFGPADLIFSHFLLPHLPEPSSALAAWSTQLRPAGLLLLDEVSDIRTTQPVFLRYLDMVEQVVNASGGQLYAGKVMEQLIATAGLEVLSSQAGRASGEHRAGGGDVSHEHHRLERNSVGAGALFRAAHRRDHLRTRRARGVAIEIRNRVGHAPGDLQGTIRGVSLRLDLASVGGVSGRDPWQRAARRRLP